MNGNKLPKCLDQTCVRLKPTSVASRIAGPMLRRFAAGQTTIIDVAETIESVVAELQILAAALQEHNKDHPPKKARTSKATKPTTEQKRTMNRVDASKRRK